MLVIRLQRTGRKNLPTFRVVLADKRWSAKRKFVEVLGHYLPAREPPQLTVDQERISKWIAKGALPSDTVARLLTKSGMKGLEKFIVPYAKKQSKKAGAAGGATSAAPAATAAKPEAKEEPK